MKKDLFARIRLRAIEIGSLQSVCVAAICFKYLREV